MPFNRLQISQFQICTGCTANRLMAERVQLARQHKPQSMLITCSPQLYCPRLVVQVCSQISFTFPAKFKMLPSKVAWVSSRSSFRPCWRSKFVLLTVHLGSLSTDIRLALTHRLYLSQVGSPSVELLHCCESFLVAPPPRMLPPFCLST